jgi:xanthine dehydrogenase small subunit
LIRFILNEKETETELPPGMVLLDFIRYRQDLKGTKIGCREGDCGACTVLVGEIVEGKLEYESMTSCLLPLGNVEGKHIVTIEGINFPGGLNPVQQAMADCGATQCGFCTPGFVMSLAGFCLSNTKPTRENAIAAVDGNICRCTGYKSIERAAEKVAAMMEPLNGAEPALFVSQKKILPQYFSTIKNRLQTLTSLTQSASDSELRTTDSELFSELPTTNYELLLGGGTDLYVQKHDEMTHADIRFVFDHPELNDIRQEGNKIILGPAVTVSDLKNSSLINEIFPRFQQYAKLISSTPIRNMATIAGNFVNASPIGDFTILFLTLNAEIELQGEKSSRRLFLREFYKGYKQLDKRPGEIISSISFEIPGKNSVFSFEKVSKRTHLDIASVNTAFLAEINDDIIQKASISAGGVGPIPMYLKTTSEFLAGKRVNEETINAAIEIMRSEISPISDARGSKEYKSLLLGQLLKAHFMKLK